MAPRKAKPGANKGKGKEKATPVEPPWALHKPPIINVEGLGKVRHLVGGVHNEWGATRLKVAGALMTDVTEVQTFIAFLAAGLVPPFSTFFLAVLEHFQVHMLHLHPNAALVLAIFT